VKAGHNLDDDRPDREVGNYGVGGLTSGERSPI